MIDYLAGRLARPPAPDAPEIGNVGKAALGPGAMAWNYEAPLWSLSRSPQRLMSQAQALYHEHPWIRLAERTVSSRGGSIEWHLEDENDDEVDDEAPPELQAIRTLLEKPQDALPRDQRQSGVQTWRGMATLTLRHMGLCGTSAWFLDQVDALAGTPLALLYLNPARLHPSEDKAGHLLGWGLDKPVEQGGTPLPAEQVLPFYLDPPDSGHFGIGIVESAGLKAHIGTAADRHISRVLDAGGRLTGIVSPKQTGAVTDEQWDEFIRQYRNIVENPDAAKRLQIVQGPIDYTRTAATMQELAIVEVANLSRDDTLTLWGVPKSQVGIALPAGLNSGQTKSYDEAILHQGAVHPRLRSLWEGIQFGLLDRYAALGRKLELVLEEPEFDDDAPKYELASKAVQQPLTRNERRKLIDWDPLPDWDPITGEPLGVAIDLPKEIVMVGAGPSEEPRPTPPQLPAPPPEPLQLGPGEPNLPAPPQLPDLGKASLRGPLLGIRRGVDARDIPATKRTLAAALREQARELSGRIRARADHLRRRRTDADVWWSDRRENDRLARALGPHVTGVSEAVQIRTSELLAHRARGKAAGVGADHITPGILDKVGTNIVRINEATRRAVQRAVSDAIDEGVDLADLADALEEIQLENGEKAFGELRAETIARTELMNVYNEAAIRSYAEFGVASVQAIDGDGDLECAARNGAVFPLDEALGIADHPNGTLDWVPVLS